MKNVYAYFLCFMFYYNITLSQKNKEYNQMDSCNFPALILSGPSTVLSLPKHNDSVNGMKSTLQIDSIDHKFVNEFTDGKIKYYYIQDTEKNNSPALSCYLNSQTIIFFFKKNNLLNRIVYSDSCTTTEIDFDEKEHIIRKYFCDFSKPDNCYSKSYTNGVIKVEIDYEPLVFSGVKDVSLLQSKFQVEKTIPIKYIYYDSNGNKVSEEKVDSKLLYKE